MISHLLHNYMLLIAINTTYIYTFEYNTLHLQAALYDHMRQLVIDGDSVRVLLVGNNDYSRWKCWLCTNFMTLMSTTGKEEGR